MTMKMMKYLNNILIMFAIVSMAFFQSCNSEEILEDFKQNVTIKSCNISCSILNDVESRASSIKQWSEGDKLFVKFGPRNNYGSYTNVGIATFSEGTWVMELRGSSNTLSVVTEERCWITYIKGNYTIADTDLNLSDDCSIYSTDEGIYTVSSDGDLYISATLNPTLSRFRIRGERNSSYELKGIRWISKTFDMWWGNGYDWANITESKTLTCSIEENGYYYSPYVYGLALGVAPLKIKSGSKVFARTNPPFTDGKSYEIIAPSVSSHDNWEVEDYVSKKFTISKTNVTGMVDLTNYDLIDLKAELKSKIGISIDGYIPCSTTNSSEDSRVFLRVGGAGYTHGSYIWGHHVQSTNDETLLDTYNYNNDYFPSFKAFVWSWSGVTSYEDTYHLYVCGYNAYVSSGSYVYLSNF